MVENADNLFSLVIKETDIVIGSETLTPDVCMACEA